jgi:hypothetical protein
VRRSLYPNPDAVQYASTQPTGFPCQLTTQDPARLYPLHHHGAWLNAEGNGNTDLRSGHFHRVVDGRVQPDPSDGHTHQLTSLPCGWGAPRTIGRDGQMPSQALMMGADDPVPAPAPMRVERPSMVPWVVGAVVVVGLVVGGVLLMRSEEG